MEKQLVTTAGINVSLSSDGTIIAIGAHLNGDGDSGHVRVFSLASDSTAVITTAEPPAEITITADSAGVPFSLSSTQNSTNGSSSTAASTLNDSGAHITDSGSISFTDLDLTNTSLVTRSFISATPSAGASVSTALDAALQDIANSFTIAGAGVGSAATPEPSTGTFSIDNALTQYLAADQSIDVAYRITITDDSNITTGDEINVGSQDVVITINGANDNPVLSS